MISYLYNLPLFQATVRNLYTTRRQQSGKGSFFIMELLGAIFDVIRCLGVPTCRYIDHHRKLEERMEDLQTRLDLLNTQKSNVELRIKAELGWGKILREEVEKWLQDVQIINDEIKVIDQKVQTVSWLLRAHLGKRVAQKLERVGRIIERGRFTEALVIDNPSSTGMSFQMEHLEGETIVMEEIWNYLMGDDIGMIGVCGMGGIGKTTVMKHIYNRLLKETKPLFDAVIWVTVSKELSITKLQREIALAVKVTLPELEQEWVAALMDKLGQRRYVLILDDVWKGFSLLEVGIPKPTSSNGSKLVLTSRSIDVCKSMDCEVIKVRPLSNDESMNLFLEHVGRGVLKVLSLTEILDRIIQECAGLPLAIVTIAGSMKGIYDVHEWRNALRELEEHVRSVRGTDIEIFERLKFSYDRLGDSRIQNCFLYCSLYPEDCNIPRMELIEYWIDEGFLGIGNRQEMHDRGHTILNRLENNCLLERDGNRDNVKMHDVMRDTALYIKSFSPSFMVKAGVGLEELPSKQEWAEDLEKVSLMNNSISEIPPDLSPKCEILSTLLLQNNISLQRIPEPFFHHMHMLCILDLSYTRVEQLPNSLSNLEKLNALVLLGCSKLRYVPSLEKLKGLRKLDLGDTAMEKVPHGMEMLANLTYLNLCTESLKELPIAILSKLSSLQCLILCVESSALNMKGFELASLRKLETFEGRFSELMEFNMYSKSIKGQRLTSYLLVMAPAEAKFDASPLKVKKSLTFLKLNRGVECEESHVSRLMKILLGLKGLEYLAVDRAARNVTVYGAVRLTKIVKRLRRIACDEPIVESISAKRPQSLPRKDVILSGCCQIGREDPVVLPTDLWCLRIFECHNLRSLIDISLPKEANELRLCSIHDCRMIESVLDLSSSSSSSPFTPFQNLELLWLENLDKLQMLVKVGEASVFWISPAGIFSHLESLKIEGCSNMKQLFPFELGLRNLQSLKSLVVKCCQQMEEIVASEEKEEPSQKGKGTCFPATRFTLPKLRKLELKKLPKLKSICSSNWVMVCDSLEKIEVRKCPKLKRIPLHLPFFQDTHRPPTHPLKVIRVYPEEWWKSVEWDYPSAKNVLQPWLVVN